ncbi:class I SAM-dependent methyltransferase [Candidatus Bathyarchaeota archaeon]|jgi:release factor glutamine methyltransferase|nr:class I SAM-dependent methyltransferase [Candidatus Bathyarchaeota archaeon]
MHSSTKKVFFAEYVFTIFEDVYEPAEDSFLFAENLVAHDSDSVIDVGTGCGILGVVAAARANRVLAVDINSKAVGCAKENAKLNHVDHKMLFMVGDLFTSIKVRKQFDLILFNAPYLPSEEFEGDSWLVRAWAGGSSGRRLIDRFIQAAPKYLRPDGRILLMQSTLSDVEETLHSFEETSLRADVIARQVLPFFEAIVLIKAESTKK